MAPQIGAASEPPAAPGMIVFGRSNPSHTPATRSGVIPMNQTSVLSLVVPVLPATGSSGGTKRRTAPPGPRPTASRTLSRTGQDTRRPRARDETSGYGRHAG